MRPDQLPLLHTVSAASAHPGGEWAAVSVVRPDFDADAYVGQLWRVPLDGSPARRITRGFRDTLPKVSPDGRLIGFLRATPDGPPQLHLVRAEGGEPMPLTDAPLGVSDFALAPDSSRLAYLARVPDEGRHGTVEGVSAAQEDPRRIDNLQYQFNGVGWTADKRVHLFVLDVPDPDGEPPVAPVGRAAQAITDPKAAKERLLPASRQVTAGASDHAGLAFTPDGSAIVTASARHGRRHEDLIAGLQLVALDSGEVRPLTDPETDGLDCHSVVVTTAGALFCTGVELGPDGLDFVARNPGVFAVELDGTSPPRRLTPGDLDVAADLAADGDAVLAVERFRGASRVWRVSADGTNALVASGGFVADHVGSAAGRVLLSVHTPTSAGEVALVEDGSIRPLTDFSARLRAATRVAEPRELVAASSDGYEVHGWVVLPEGEGPHPVLLNIHGGPYADYTGSFFDEAQVYAEAGYAVVLCNPRGAAGYGPDHGAAIRGDFGRLDSQDVLAFLDHALAVVPGLDADRVGVMGGSYGGYLTAWLIAHEHRFAAAIVERGFLDPASFIGSSDIGWFFPQGYNGADRAAMDAQSPTLLTDQVRTPTLVLHSEQDLRCPLAQALRYYTQLKLAGVEAELLVFPGENHELSRSGTPWHRRRRFEAILGWWARYLPVGRAEG